MLKNLVLFAIFSIGIFSIGLISVAEAHPHATIELINTHSHDLYTTEDFVIHAFEEVILFVHNIQSLIFG